MERSYYRTVCDDAKRNIRTIFTENGVFSPPPPFSRREPCSVQSTMHYSFDMAQQVHYPSNPFQPGPIYFLTPRKCALFGVCCEAIPRQINYLIDEACNTGKGSNTIVSLLHHFFEVHGLGEQQVHLHADNCVGQNKNNTMLHYLLWRTLVGLHTQITLSFLVVGHTKFAPDWCFGLLKQRFRRTNVGCLDDIAQVVDSSASANVAQLVGTQEGEMVVQMYDWTGMFAAHFCKLKNIKAYHHFRFDASMPGAVFFKATSNSEEEMIVLQKNTTWSPVASDLPNLFLLLVCHWNGNGIYTIILPSIVQKPSVTECVPNQWYHLLHLQGNPFQHQQPLCLHPLPHHCPQLLSLLHLLPCLLRLLVLQQD